MSRPGVEFKSFVSLRAQDGLQLFADGGVDLHQIPRVGSKVVQFVKLVEPFELLKRFLMIVDADINEVIRCAVVSSTLSLHEKSGRLLPPTIPASFASGH